MNNLELIMGSLLEECRMKSVSQVADRWKQLGNGLDRQELLSLNVTVKSICQLSSLALYIIFLNFPVFLFQIQLVLNIFSFPFYLQYLFLMTLAYFIFYLSTVLSP